MKTPKKPPVPAGERAFGFQAQVPCQGLLASCDVGGVNFEVLARDVRLTDRPARRRELVDREVFVHSAKTKQFARFSDLKGVSYTGWEETFCAQRAKCVQKKWSKVNHFGEGHLPGERPRRTRVNGVQQAARSSGGSTVRATRGRRSLVNTARARAQAHQRLGTFQTRAVHRTAHGSTVAKSKSDDDLPEQASLYARGSPSSRPRDGGFAGGARTREDTLSPQRSEDEREGGLTTEYNEFAELSRQTVEFLNADMTTVRETLYDVVYDDNGVNGDRDALGRITKKTEWIVSGDEPNGDGTPRGLDSRTYDYGYNPEGRPWLESVAVDGDVVSSYGYDDNGNRTSAELSWSQLGYDAKFDVSLSEGDTEYDSADKLLVYGSKSYEWNNFGQLSSMTDSDPDSDPLTVGSETTFYQYDLFGNLLRVDLPDGRAIEYDVDGAGRRVGRRELDSAGNEISFRGWIYRDLLRPIAEVDRDGNVVARYVYQDGSGARQNGIGQLSTRIGATQDTSRGFLGSNVPYAIELFDAVGNLVRRLTLTKNQVGSVVLVTDSATGDVVQRIEYDEFGRTVFDSSPGLQPFGFGGGLLDDQSGLLRFGARDYSAEIGRWTARDPVRFTGGPNAYLYAAADPTMRRDVTGLKPPRRIPVSPWDIGQLLCGLVTGEDCSLLPDWKDPEIYGNDGPAQCGLLEAAGYECCGTWDNVYACPPENDTECDPRFQSCEPEDVQCGGEQSWSSW